LINLRSEQAVEESLSSSGGLLGLGGVLGLDALLLDCKFVRKKSTKAPQTQKLTDLLPAQGLSVRVETEEDGLVDKGVLLLCPGALLHFLSSRTDDGLDFIGVDEAGDVRVGDFGGGEAKLHKHEQE